MLKKSFSYIFLSLFAIFLAFVVFLVTTESGKNMRETVAASILSSQHRSWAWVSLVSKQRRDEILNNIQNPTYDNALPVLMQTPSPAVQNTPNPTSPPNLSSPPTDGSLLVRVDTIKQNYGPAYYYEGKIMEISNPKNVRLAPSNLKNYGEQIFVLAKQANAVGAINASGFVDPGGVGNGGTATGVEIVDGKIKSNNANSKAYTAAITNDGVFLSGFYSASELINLGAKYAAGFKPQLISNGKKMITDGDGGWGIGPRTAIGQKQDGTIVFLVIDGRQKQSIGATVKEVQNIMYDRGAVNAMCMDGGSSSSMWFNGENITTPSSVGSVPRYLPDAWLVVPDKDQTFHLYEDGVQIK